MAAISRRLAMQLLLDPLSFKVPNARDATGAPPTPLISIHDSASHCQTCCTREHCLPLALTSDQLKQFDGLITKRIRLRKNDALFRTGDAFSALYSIRYGSVKTTILTEDGWEQISGYHILGEIIGFDGIATHIHGVGATALEDTEVCALPFMSIEGLSRTLPVLQHNLHQLMSKEIGRDQNMMFILGSMNAEQRLAAFLLNLASRYRRRGYSSTEFTLRLTREELGSYLGLKLETVSRMFSRFQAEGIVQAQGRSVKLLDSGALKRITERNRAVPELAC